MKLSLKMIRHQLPIYHGRGVFFNLRIDNWGKPDTLVSGFKISQLLAYFPKSLIQFSIVRSLRCFDWATLDEVLAIHSFLGGVSEYPAYNN